jgi:hypothetical protein
VVDLANPLDKVAVVLEVLTQRHDLGEGCAKMGVEVVDAGGVGPGPGEDAGAGRGADRLLAVRPEKCDPRPGEAIEVGAVHVLGPIGTKLGAEVIDGDEQHIGPVPGTRRAGAPRPSQA